MLPKLAGANQTMADPARRSGVRGLLMGGAAFAALAAGLALPSPVSAQTLSEALSLAYETNPVLQAQRARLRETDESLAQALSNWRPTVSVSGEIGKTTTEVEQFGSEVRSSTNTRTPARATLALNQPIYRGGRTTAETDRAEASIQAQRAQLVATEQQVFLQAATAYMNVIRDEATLELRMNNVQRLQRQLEATRDQFNVGEVTRTDVAQAEARLAQSQADRVAAEGQLAASREGFIQVVGIAPTRLSEPDVPLDTPADRETVLTEAAQNNPGVITQRFSISSVEAQTRQIFGETLPQVNLRVEVSRFENQQLRDSRTDEASIFATVSVPLYQAGSVSSRVRQSKQQETRAHNALEDARRSAVSNAAAAHDNLAAAKARIESLVTVIGAAEIALDGVQEEAKVGSRTILDILDAEQELLNAQVSLVSAQRDEIVYKLELLTAIGGLTAHDLGLQVQFYDFEKHYRETRGRWWGFDISKD